MKVLVTLEYELTGDVAHGVASLHDSYRFYQGRVESASGSSPDYHVRCVSPVAQITTDDNSVVTDLKTLRNQCTEGSDVADVLDSCIERLEGRKQ